MSAARWPIVLLACSVALLVVFLLALGIGVTTKSPWDVVALLCGGGNDLARDALWQVRLPRVLVAGCCGVALAIAGAILQTLTRNPLADSGVLGINAGAGVAMVALLATFPSYRIAPAWLLPVAATCGGVFSAVLVQALSWQAGRLPGIRLLLIGIAVGATAGAIMLVIAVQVDASLLRFVVAWQAGTMSGRTMGDVALIAPVAVIGFVASLAMHRHLDVLQLGDDVAVGVGARVGHLQGLLVMLAAVLAATTVTVAGNLGFVGLIAPHIARLLVGSAARHVIPVTAIVGAIIVITADTAARILVQPVQLPTGVLVAVLGAPVLLITLARWSRP